MIYNKHRPQGIPERAVLVDRTTQYGNPVRMRTATRSERARSLLGFCRYLLASPALVADIRRNLRGKDLVCWCYPLDCHAEIIQQVANSENPVAVLELAVVKWASVIAGNRPLQHGSSNDYNAEAS
jgi:hypothetical protein